MWPGAQDDCTCFRNLLLSDHTASDFTMYACFRMLESIHADGLHIQASWEIRCAAWALSTNAPVDPLIVFTASSAIFILDVKTQKIIGKLRGHGGVSIVAFSFTDWSSYGTRNSAYYFTSCSSSSPVPVLYNIQGLYDSGL